MDSEQKTPSKSQTVIELIQSINQQSDGMFISNMTAVRTYEQFPTAAATAGIYTFIWTKIVYFSLPFCPQHLFAGVLADCNQ